MVAPSEFNRYEDAHKKNKMMNNNNKHIKFFNSLLEKTKAAYHKSDVFKNYAQKNWGYSITATSFVKNATVIVGFNWGVDKKLSDQGKSHGPQEFYPIKNFTDLDNDLGSLKRTLNYFRIYFDSNPEVQRRRIK
jgi:hypothetical protein